MAWDLLTSWPPPMAPIPITQPLEIPNNTMCSRLDNFSSEECPCLGKWSSQTWKHQYSTNPVVERNKFKLHLIPQSRGQSLALTWHKYHIKAIDWICLAIIVSCNREPRSFANDVLLPRQYWYHTQHQLSMPSVSKYAQCSNATALISCLASTKCAQSSLLAERPHPDLTRTPICQKGIDWRGSSSSSSSSTSSFTAMILMSMGGKETGTVYIVQSVYVHTLEHSSVGCHYW